MSGGNLYLNKYQVKEVSKEIQDYIERNDIEEGLHFTVETLKRAEIAARLLDVAADAMDNVDKLLSGDFGEDSFKESFKDDEIEERIKSIIKLVNRCV